VPSQAVAARWREIPMARPAAPIAKKPGFRKELEPCPAARRYSRPVCSLPVTTSAGSQGVWSHPPSDGKVDERGPSRERRASCVPIKLSLQFRERCPDWFPSLKRPKMRDSHSPLALAAQDRAAAIATAGPKGMCAKTANCSVRVGARSQEAAAASCELR
jgi:hypothetical protein